MFLKKLKEITPPKKYLLLAAILSLAMCIYLFFRQNLEEYFAGKSSDLFSELLETAYPRLRTEKHRFDTAFFVQKSDQVFLRFVLVVFVLSILFDNKAVQKKVQKLFEKHIKEKTLDFIAIYVYGLSLFRTLGLYEVMLMQSEQRLFYEPFGILALLDLSYPSQSYLVIFFLSKIIFSLFCIFRFRAFYFSILYAISFLLLQNYIYAFGKIDHTFAVWNYVLMFMPLLFYASENSKDDKLSALGLFLMQKAVLFAYFFAGLEKLMVSGFAWISEAHFDTFFGGELAALLFQLSALYFVFCPRRILIFVVLGFLFHSFVYLYAGIGYFFNSFTDCYPLFFVLYFEKKFNGDAP